MSLPGVFSLAAVTLGSKSDGTPHCITRLLRPHCRILEPTPLGDPFARLSIILGARIDKLMTERRRAPATPTTALERCGAGCTLLVVVVVRGVVRRRGPTSGWLVRGHGWDDRGQSWDDRDERRRRDDLGWGDDGRGGVEVGRWARKEVLEGGVRGERAGLARAERRGRRRRVVCSVGEKRWSRERVSLKGSREMERTHRPRWPS